MCIKYYDCVSVFLPLLSGRQIASFKRRVILSSEACLILTHLSTLSHKQHDFRKNVIEYEQSVLVFSRTFV